MLASGLQARRVWKAAIRAAALLSLAPDLKSADGAIAHSTGAPAPNAKEEAKSGRRHVSEAYSRKARPEAVAELRDAFRAYDQDGSGCKQTRLVCSRAHDAVMHARQILLGSNAGALRARVQILNSMSSDW